MLINVQQRQMYREMLVARRQLGPISERELGLEECITTMLMTQSTTSIVAYKNGKQDE